MRLLSGALARGLACHAPLTQPRNDGLTGQTVRSTATAAMHASTADWLVATSSSHLHSTLRA